MKEADPILSPPHQEKVTTRREAYSFMTKAHIRPSAAAKTYCLPSSKYVIGPFVTPPILEAHNVSPVVAL